MPTRLPLRLALLLLATAPAFDALAASGCEDLRGGEITPRVSWLNDIKPIFVTHCRGCHFAGRPDFSDTTSDPVYKLHVQGLLEARAPESSPLFVQINCSDPGSFPQMPLGNLPLSNVERELIYDWIAQGAVADPGMSIPVGAPYDAFVLPTIFVDSYESIRR